MREPRTALPLRIREIVQVRVRYGYRKIRVLLNREGWQAGKKLVYRLYREEGLTLRLKPKRRRCAARNSRECTKAMAPNQVWSLDFMADQLTDGQRFRALMVVDVFMREGLAIELDVACDASGNRKLISSIPPMLNGARAGTQWQHFLWIVLGDFITTSGPIVRD